MGEVREGEARVAGRELLVDGGHGGGVHPGAAVGLGDGEPEHAELAEAAEEREVEALVAVEGLGLRVDLGLGEGAHHLAQRAVLVGGVEEVVIAGVSIAQAASQARTEATTFSGRREAVLLGEHGRGRRGAEAVDPDRRARRGPPTPATGA